MSDLKKGDYVLATRWLDGDPCDPFVVGHYSHMDGTRFAVTYSNGKTDVTGRFRRCEIISAEIGALLLSIMPVIGDKPGQSVWFWRDNPELAKGLIEAGETMSEEKCPRCEHNIYSPKFQMIAASTVETSDREIKGTFYKCGSYDILLVGFKESELCETRQELRSEKTEKEKAEAELAEVLAIHKRDYAAYFKAHQEEIKELKEKLEISGDDGMFSHKKVEVFRKELAKREKALIEAMKLAGVIDHGDRWELLKERPEWVMKEKTPELAEWRFSNASQAKDREG